MAEQTIASGVDAHVAENNPDRVLSDARFPKLSNATGARKRVLLSISPGDVFGQTVVSAVLSFRVQEPVGNQTVTVRPLTGRWSAATVTWNNQPGTVASPSASVATGAVAAGGTVSVDVTALVQAIAAGVTHHGWQLTTSSGDVLAILGFGSGAGKTWELSVVTSDAPEAPALLTPSGGTVSAAKPRVASDYTDLSGNSDVSAVQVRVDPDRTAPYAFVSAEVATDVAELDLAATSSPAYPGLADGATTFWQIRVKSSAGVWSSWSDWAQMTRAVKSALVIDRPAAGTLYDSTPTIKAHLASGTAIAWRVRVLDAQERERYDSGVIAMFTTPGGGGSGPSSEFSKTLPFKVPTGFVGHNEQGQVVGSSGARVVFPRDGQYVIEVSARDRTDRQWGGAQDSPWITARRTVTFSGDGSLPAPTSLSATPLPNRPGVRLAWRGQGLGAADAFAVLRHGVRVDRVDAADVQAGTNQWVYEFPGAPPNTVEEWTVRALHTVNGDLRESDDSPVAAAKNDVTGVWLLSDHGNVRLDGDEISSLVLTERRNRIELPYRADPVDLVGALGGIGGTFTGYLLAGRNSTEADRAVLRAIRQHPARPLWLVYGTTVAPVVLAGVSVTDDARMIPEYDQYVHVVSFEVTQVADFDLAG